MSILILGKSCCKLCGNVLYRNEESISFPAFVINQVDPVAYYSDENFHSDCLNKISEAQEARALAQEFINRIKPTSRICAISGNLITDPNDHLFIELLTSDKNSPLYRFNYLHLCRSQLKNWTERAYFKKQITTLVKSGTWQESNPANPYLNGLIQAL